MRWWQEELLTFTRPLQWHEAEANLGGEDDGIHETHGEDQRVDFRCNFDLCYISPDQLLSIAETPSAASSSCRHDARRHQAHQTRSRPVLAWPGPPTRRGTASHQLSASVLSQTSSSRTDIARMGEELAIWRMMAVSKQIRAAVEPMLAPYLEERELIAHPRILRHGKLRPLIHRRDASLSYSTTTSLAIRSLRLGSRR